MNLVFLGPPGAGKGTQAKILREKKGILPVSTGDILRKAVEEKTTLGQEAKKYMDAGELVPDEVVIGIIRERIVQEDTKSNGFLLDGFPRTVEQADALGRILGDSGMKLDKVVLFFADETELKKRMLERAKLEGRTDDNPDTIQNRLAVYKEKTQPLVDYYTREGLLVTVDALGEVQEVSERLYATLNGK